MSPLMLKRTHHQPVDEEPLNIRSQICSMVGNLETLLTQVQTVIRDMGKVVHLMEEVAVTIESDAGSDKTITQIYEQPTLTKARPCKNCKNTENWTQGQKCKHRKHILNIVAKETHLRDKTISLLNSSQASITPPRCCQHIVNQQSAAGSTPSSESTASTSSTSGFHSSCESLSRLCSQSVKDSYCGVYEMQLDKMLELEFDDDLNNYCIDDDDTLELKDHRGSVDYAMLKQTTV